MQMKDRVRCSELLVFLASVVQVQQESWATVESGIENCPNPRACPSDWAPMLLVGSSNARSLVLNYNGVWHIELFSLHFHLTDLTIWYINGLATYQQQKQWRDKSQWSLSPLLQPSLFLKRFETYGDESTGEQSNCLMAALLCTCISERIVFWKLLCASQCLP